MAIHGIDPAAHVPTIFANLRHDRHPRYRQFAGISVEEPGGVLSILRESGEATGPLLLTALCQETESPKSWHQTGNPFYLEELWSSPVNFAGPGTSAPFRELPLIREICSSFGIPEPVWSPLRHVGLPENSMPQNRWLPVPFHQLAHYLEERLARSRLIALGERAPVPRDAKGQRIYVSTTSSLPMWLKIGMAGTSNSPLSRMQAHQCCNWRRFRFRRVWEVGEAKTLRTIETDFKRQIGKHAQASRSEWFRLNHVEHGLADLDRYADAKGYLREITTLPLDI